MKKKILALLQSQYSLNDIERKYHYGLISKQVFNAYVAVWNWVAPRLGGSIGHYHDTYWNTHGKHAYYKRINKVRAAFNLKLIETD